jgi:hypothetical protein
MNLDTSELDTRGWTWSISHHYGELDFWAAWVHWPHHYGPNKRGFMVSTAHADSAQEALDGALAEALSHVEKVEVVR